MNNNLSTHKQKPSGSLSQKIQEQRQLRYLSQSALLEETGSQRLILFAIATVCVIVVVLLFWSAITHIKEIAVANGEILPNGQIHVVQHLEGGIVKKLHVANGDHVTKGQILVTLNPTATLAELQQLRSRELSLMLDKTRLQSFVSEHSSHQFRQIAAQLVTEKAKYWSQQYPHQLEKTIHDEAQLLDYQNLSRDDERKILQLQIQQRLQEQHQLQQQSKTLEKHIQLIRKEKNIYDRLKSSEAVSDVTHLAISRQLNQALGERRGINNQLTRTLKAHQEAQKRLQALNSRLQERARQDIRVTGAELLELRNTLRKLKDRADRLNVRAPVDGIVKGTEILAGSVIPPGAFLMEIVPLGQQLSVKARISTRDIGHVHIGDPVNVKVSTYDFTRYGAIDGTLKSVSASTFFDTDGRPYYKGIITLSKNYVGNNSDQNQLIPGMTVIADIVTGDKSLLSYLLKPIRRSFDNAFRER